MVNVSKSCRLEKTSFDMSMTLFDYSKSQCESGSNGRILKCWRKEISWFSSGPCILTNPVKGV